VVSLGDSENAIQQASIFKPSGFTWRLGKCDPTGEHFQAKWFHLAARKMRSNNHLTHGRAAQSWRFRLGHVLPDQILAICGSASLDIATFAYHVCISRTGEGCAQRFSKGIDMTFSNDAAAQGLERILSDLADSCPVERARLEAASRVLTAARRAAGLHLPSSEATRAVAEILRHWDAEALTALEYAESLPVAVLDRLLRAAPAWAAAASRTLAKPDRHAA
jgi:hypothetical protein